MQSGNPVENQQVETPSEGDCGMTTPLLRVPKPPHRTIAELWEHYQVEKKLANVLRAATRTERRRLYSAAYEELFRRVPHHGQLTRKVSESERSEHTSAQMRLLNRFLKPDTSFLEIGAGDCALSLSIARRVREVYALDVSALITQADGVPANFHLVLSDGTSIPVPHGSIDVAYSNQLMEHLHPDDALEQLANIYRALAPGGVYICITPNRLTGPHDISRYFDSVACGFHLKEYTITELRALFRKVGFRKITHYARYHGTHVAVPSTVTRALESGINAMSDPRRDRVARSRAVRGVLEIRLAARK
jgi:SAM-dependent methyltransferase